MTCAACQIHVERALQAVPGVETVSVDLLGNSARVRGSVPLDPQALATAIRNAGYEVGEAANRGASAAARDVADENGADNFLGLRAALTLAAGAVAMTLSMPLAGTTATSAADPLNRWLQHLIAPRMPAALMALPPDPVRWTLCAMALAAMLFAAPEIYVAAWRAARHRSTNMNTLVALGTLSAFAVSFAVTLADALHRPLPLFGDVYYEAVVLILGFLLAGRWLEARARRRALRDVGSFARSDTSPVRWLGDTAPGDPETLFGAPETLLPVDAVAVDDILRILPGDRVPVDAEILAGRSSIDESMLTGEPLPVTRIPGDRLLGGTLNLDGALILRATASGADSTLARMANLLERARSARAPLQRLADRASAVFVPSVLCLAALTFAVWAVADNTGVHRDGFGRAISLAISVLIIACPCAMGLAVPATLAVALGTGARAGLLFKDGEAIERLAGAQVIAFDKTGTLTEGRPEIQAFLRTPASVHPEPALLAWAAAVEGLSTHPLATAVCAFARRDSRDSAGSLREGRVLPGTGAEATVDGHHVAVGNAALLGSAQAQAAPEGLRQATPLYIVVDGVHEATLYAFDTLRPSATGLAAAMTSLGLRTVLLTGDTAEAAGPIAATAGITDIRARLSPEAKVLAIESLQRENLQQGGLRVAMAGDGLNDAAALAQADAGIAVASGTDLARDAGGILLLRHDLRLIPLAVRLARKTQRLMRQSLAWAAVYNVLGIPLAAGVLLPRFGIALSPALASAAMALSSVSVLLNALRLAHLPAAWRLTPLPSPVPLPPVLPPPVPPPAPPVR